MLLLSLSMFFLSSSWSLSAQADTLSTPRPTTVEELLLLLEEEHELRFHDCSTSRLRIRLCSQNKVETADVNATLRAAFSSSEWEDTKKRSRLKTVLGPRSVTVAIHNAKQRVSVELAPPLPDCVARHSVPHVDVFKDEPSFTQPKMVNSTHAEFPSRALLEVKNARIAGLATISTEGQIVDTCLIKVSAEGYGFETEFFKSLRHWRFEPATVNGEPIAVRFTVMTEWSAEMR